MSERPQALELAMLAFQMLIGQRDNPEFHKVKDDTSAEEWDSMAKTSMARLEGLPYIKADLGWLEQQFPQYTGVEVGRKLASMRLPQTGLFVDLMGARPTEGLPEDPYYPGDGADRCVGCVLAPNMVAKDKHSSLVFVYGDDGKPVDYAGIMGFCTSAGSGVECMPWPMPYAENRILLGATERAVRAVEYNLGRSFGPRVGFGKSTMRRSA